MTVEDLGPAERRRRLRSGRLGFRIGPFVVHLRSAVEAIDRSVGLLYARYPLDDGVGGHFRLWVDAPSLARRLFRPQVQADFDGQQPFIPLPRSMAAPMLEAGLNWCIGTHAHQFLTIHAATMERGGVALVMPAPPGSGKSTLCAALVARGWRLLSDEFALIDPATGELVAVPRPIALKDGSIEMIRAWWPEAVFGVPAINNENQTVVYVRAPEASVVRAEVRCRPAYVVIPKYTAGAPPVLTPLSPARTALHLADSSFNYNLHGRIGFERIVEIADGARGFTFEYSRVEDGVDAIGRLAVGSGT